MLPICAPCSPVKVLERRRWVDQGKLVTSAGISAGIDMSLHLLERLAGRGLAEATARQMEFDWQEDAGPASWSSYGRCTGSDTTGA